MSGWRVPIILLLVVLLLGSILIIKISNNNSKKHIVVEDVGEYIEENKGKIGFYIFINNVFYKYIPTIILIVAMIGIYKLYVKLGVSKTATILFLVSLIALIWAITFKSSYTIKHGFFAKPPIIYNIVFFVALPLAGITLIVTQLQFFNLINLKFMWFLVLVIVPYFIGDFMLYGGILKIICAIILGIIVGLKLSEVYAKEGKFKMGLCVLPMVFIPILGFKEE